MFKIPQNGVRYIKRFWSGEKVQELRHLLCMWPTSIQYWYHVVTDWQGENSSSKLGVAPEQYMEQALPQTKVFLNGVQLHHMEMQIRAIKTIFTYPPECKERIGYKEKSIVWM